MRRQILHVDMNSFYASVEQAFDPSLRGKAVAVTGAAEKRHGIILAKSPEAKAKGVQTGEVIWKAKQKCSELITVEAHFERYQLYSHLARSIYLEYTDRVEPYGLDECWMDVSGSSRLFGDGWAIATTIRERIRRELGVTVSIGVSDNKVFAKLGSDLRKPDAQTRLDASNFRACVWPLPVSSLLFAGRQTTKALLSFGITTIGELANADRQLIAHRFHRNGIKLQEAAQGRDSAPVLPYGVRPIAKSISCGTTFTRDLYTEADISVALLDLADHVQSRLVDAGLSAEGLAVWARDRRLVVTHAADSLPYPTQSAQTLAHCAMPLAQSLFDPRIPLRSLTLCATALRPTKESVQTLLFSDIQQHDKWERVADTVEELRARYGKRAAGPATLSSFALADLDAPRAPMPLYLSVCHALHDTRDKSKSGYVYSTKETKAG
ncbi:DNA polymerase IV [Murdochiella sp. Marseille-P8839]|nr:DNA polymerase IV [Murdochiella sp. Marseille-P8839]